MQRSLATTLMIGATSLINGHDTHRDQRRGNLRAALGLAFSLVGLLALASPAVRAQGAGRYYPSFTRIDLTATPYSADPSGVVEASGPINKAIKDYAGTGAILYLPAGTYRITNQINYANDNNANEVTLMGAGQGATVLQVPANWGFGGYVIETNANTNTAFGVSISDLKISIGAGNPSASGIDFHASNQGTLANVTITRNDTNSVNYPNNPNKTAGGTGIFLGTPGNGPLLVKNVTVQGFQFGVDAEGFDSQGYEVSEYSATLEHVTVSGQHAAGANAGGAGLRAGGAVLAVRDLKSTQTAANSANVPGVLLYSTSAHLALLGSTLTGNGGNAIVQNGQRLLVRGVTTSGYSDTYPSETVSNTVLTLQSSTAATLKLPIKETPDEWDNNPADWEAVANSGGGDDTQNIKDAIQKALTKGESVIYFPRVYWDGTSVWPDGTHIMSLYPRYGIGSTITVPPGIKYILGMGNQIDQCGDLGGNFNPMFQFANGSAGSAVYFRDFRNINYNGAVTLWQDSTPADLVLSHVISQNYPVDKLKDPTAGGGAYNIIGGTGALYVEDVSVGSGWQLSQGQKVWARQFNPEDPNSSGVRSLVDNNGATLWTLGYKTEGAGPWITTRNGGSTELFGGYNYVNTYLSTFPNSVAPYQVTDANASLDFGTTKGGATWDYNDFLQVTRSGTTTVLSGPQIYSRDITQPGPNPYDYNRDVPLFVSTSP